MQSQAYIFLIFILNGLLIGIIFDIFRILRKSFKTSNFITYIQDIAFWLLSGLILLYSIFKFNNGELRVFIFIGVVLGLSLYLLAFSKLFINVSVYIIQIIKKIIYLIFIIPLKYIFLILKNIIYKPLKNLGKKIVKIFRKIFNFFKKINLKKLFYKKKKDFA